MLDTVSTAKLKKPVVLPDFDALRVERDRAIAIEFVKRGETKTARAAIASEMGLNLRLVYRATEKHLDWARTQQKAPRPHETKGPASTDACAPATQSLAQAPTASK